MNTRDRAIADRARFESWVQYAEQSGDRPALPAATVVVLRDTETGPRTLMLRRNSKIAFGGMWVFPGGRIDPDDYANNGDVVAAARRAAVREAREEAQIEVDADSMVLFAHWIPPPIAPKRFATWFFAARADNDHAVIDDGEIVEMQWSTPANVLERHHNGEVELVPPTWVTLHTLRGFTTVKAALTTLADRAPRHHATRIARSGEDPVVMWEGDAGYDSANANVAGSRHRLTMAESGYVYEDSSITEARTRR